MCVSVEGEGLVVCVRYEGSCGVGDWRPGDYEWCVAVFLVRYFTDSDCCERVGGGFAVVGDADDAVVGEQFFVSVIGIDEFGWFGRSEAASAWVFSIFFVGCEFLVRQDKWDSK